MRNYKKKTSKGYSVSKLIMAAKHTRLWGSSIREVSRLYKIPFSTLRRCVQRHETISIDSSVRKPGRSRVFTEQQETELVELMCFKTRTRKKVLRLVYRQSQIWKTNYPVSWKRKNTAGIDWMHSFLRRYPISGLFIRKGKGHYTDKTKCAECLVFNPKRSLFCVCRTCFWGVCVKCNTSHNCGKISSRTP